MIALGRTPVTPCCWRLISPAALGWGRIGGGASWGGSSSSERSTTSITVLLLVSLGTPGWGITILVWGLRLTPVFLTADMGDVGLLSLAVAVLDTGMATTPEGCLMGTPSLTSPLAGLATEFLAGLLLTLTTPLPTEVPGLLLT